MYLHPGGECGRSHQIAEHHGQLGRSASDAAAIAAGADEIGAPTAIALGRRGGRLLSVPQSRQRLRQRRAFWLSLASLGRPEEVAKAEGPAVLHDGGGLYLRVSATGAKSWVFRFQLDGKRPRHGTWTLRSRTRAERRQSTGS